MLKELIKAVNKDEYTMLVVKKMYLLLTAASKKAKSNKGHAEAMKC